MLDICGCPGRPMKIYVANRKAAKEQDEAKAKG